MGKVVTSSKWLFSLLIPFGSGLVKTGCDQRGVRPTVIPLPFSSLPEGGRRFCVGWYPTIIFSN